MEEKVTEYLKSCDKGELLKIATVSIERLVELEEVGYREADYTDDDDVWWNEGLYWRSNGIDITEQ